jgi:two-component system, NtrC family, sensor kinase
MISTDTQATPAKAKHVLVVDDDIELTMMYQSLLQLRNYRVSTAGNGVEALRLVRNDDVDAVLCDLTMPELSGDLFYQAVGRARPHLLKRFIFITGNADNPIYEPFLKSIKAPVLTKPISFGRLFENLKAILAN